MIDFINSWVQGIIIAVIISTIIEMILPDGTIKKYVRTVIGAYIVFVIASPIITKITGKQINLDSYKLPETKMQKTATIDTNAYIESTYINNIKEDIIKNIEEKGYKVTKVTVEIDKTEEKYGNINSINMQISRQNNLNNLVEPVEININDDIKRTESIEANEIEGLKKFLKETYGTDNIIINS